MRFLVTGGAGFIGSHIVDELIQQQHDVTILDDLSSGKEENINPNATFVKGTILDLHLLNTLCKDIDYIMHMAAIPSVPVSIREPVQTHQANITGTLNVLMAAKEHNVKRVIFAASSARFGNGPEIKKSEEATIDLLSFYAAHKYTGERYCKLFCDLYGLETVNVVFFNVFGPRQDPNSEYSAVIPKFITQMVEGKQPTIFGDGTTSRDFTYVQNNVNACIKACFAEDVAGETINVASGKEYSLLDLVQTINKHLNTNLQPKFTEFRKGDVKKSLADITKAKELLQYEVSVDFEEGLKKTIEFLQHVLN